MTFDGLGRAHPSSPRPGTGSDLEADNFVTALHAPAVCLLMFQTVGDTKFSAVEQRLLVIDDVPKEFTNPLVASRPQQTEKMRFERLNMVCRNEVVTTVKFKSR